MEENWELQILVKGELGSLWSWHGIEVEETVWECCQELPSFNRRSWKNLEFLLGSPAAHPLWGSNKPLASHSLPSSVQWGQRRKGQEPCVHCGICPPPLGGEELLLRASHACPRPQPPLLRHHRHLLTHRPLPFKPQASWGLMTTCSVSGTWTLIPQYSFSECVRPWTSHPLWILLLQCSIRGWSEEGNPAGVHLASSVLWPLWWKSGF